MVESAARCKFPFNMTKGAWTLGKQLSVVNEGVKIASTIHLVDTRLTLKGANLVQKKTPNLIFSKLRVYLVAHSGIEPLFPE